MFLYFDKTIVIPPLISYATPRMPEEILDLVNEQDEVIGRLSRTEVYAQDLHNFRAIHVFVINSEGKIWIPRRVASKKFWPRSLDYSAAGHVESGEAYDTAFHREVSEEINIDTQKIPWRALGKITPSEGAFCFQMVYEIQSDQTPRYNSDDFLEAQWLFPQEIVSLIEKGEPEVVDLAYTLKKFYPSK